MKKSVKRSENLVMLSHEHHHALVFCNRLKKAKKTSSEIIKLYVADFWDHYLVSHFKMEEQLFLQFMLNSEFKAQFIAEHQQIKDLVQHILNINDDVSDLPIQLSTLLNNHIRFEERLLFPYLEKTIQPKELKKIGNAMSDLEITAHQFTPKFWEK